MTEFHFRPEHIAFLLSDAYERLRETIADMLEKYADPLTLQTALRARHPELTADLLAAGTVEASLQERYAERLRLPPGALLTPVAAQQASSRNAALYHASLFPGARRLADVCSGIGSDAIALSGRAQSVVCIERDPLLARLLGRNLELAGAVQVGGALQVGGAQALVLRGDAERSLGALRPGAVDGIFADPDRRASGRRSADPEQASPPLSFFETLPRSLPLAVKLSPAARVRDTAGEGSGGISRNDSWRRVFLAAGHECTEQLLLRGIEVPPLSVVDADSGDSWIPAGIDADPAGERRGAERRSAGRITGGRRSGSAEPHADVLIEPHAAIVASGATGAYFAALGARPVHGAIAYGLADSLPPRSRWHRSFTILEAHPFQRRRLQEAIDRLDFSPDSEIKKRGFPLLPEELRRQLRFRGTRAGVLIATRRGNRHVVFLCLRAD